MKTVKEYIAAFIIILFCAGIASAGQAVKIGEVDAVNRMVQGNDVINIIRVDDPDNPFVSIYFTTIKSGKILALADPSNTSIAARLTGEIPRDKDGKMIINTSTNKNIASVSKSIGSKVMKIGRWYDAEKNVLCYLVYTTKWLDGSLKHNLSVVPLGMPLAP
jgi:catabolite regulation protein CreA